MLDAQAPLRQNGSARILRTYLYLLSHAFSGSTLMAHLLGSHPEIATTGETSVTRGIDISRYPCSCGALIEACDFWQAVTKQMNDRGFPFTISDPDLRFHSTKGAFTDRLLRAGPRNRLLEQVRSIALTVLPTCRSETRRLLSRNEGFAEIVASVRGRSVFLDTSKHPTRLLHLARIPSFEIYVVHLLRDARAVSNSCVKNLNMPVRQAATSWVESAEACERMRRRFADDRWLTIRYEDLCRNPREVLPRIFKFARLRDDDGYLHFRNAEHHIIGNRMRLAARSEIKLDEKWRTALSAEQLSQIQAVAGRLSHGYGYA